MKPKQSAGYKFLLMMILYIILQYNPFQQVESTYFSSSVCSPEKLNPHINSDHTRLLQEVKELQKKVREAERRLQCRQCGTERVAVVFQPCSHLHLCSSCARPHDTCVTCGTIVRGTLKPIIG
ncbi:hypothetical protein OTU49_000763 [Cherax quadricarinatus]|uniref:RING-type domain-containing protein n=1 Tax=Cherax quadricarinatus TaxID=27406 RepID=A0AAW0XIH7_CHEQU